MKNLIIICLLLMPSMNSYANPASNKNIIQGNTFEWVWDEGAFKGASYNVTFLVDGQLRWRGVSGPNEGKGDTEKKYSVNSISKNIQLISWQKKSGLTVTIALNFEDNSCYGVVSTGNEWYPLSGRFKQID